jgi:hypothetical protein
MAAKCWVCPNFNSEDLIINNGVITYAGQNLSQTCCQSYAGVTNQTTTYLNGICTLNQQSQEINFGSTDVIYITQNGEIYKRNLSSVLNTSSIGGNYFNFIGTKTFLFNLPPQFAPIYDSTLGWRFMSLTFSSSRLYILNQLGTQLLIYNITLNPFTYSLVGTINKPTNIDRLYGLSISGNDLYSVAIIGSTRKLIKLNGYQSPVANGNLTYTEEFSLVKATTNTLINSNEEIRYISITNSQPKKLITITKLSNQFFINQYNFDNQYIDNVNYFNIEKGGLEFRKQLLFNVNIDVNSIINNTNITSLINHNSGSLYKITTSGVDSGSLGSYSEIYEVPANNLNGFINETNSYIIGSSQLTITNKFDVDPNAPSCYIDTNGNPVLGPQPC